MSMSAAGNQRQVVDLVRALTGQANILTIPRLFIDFMNGELEAALFLSQCLYWSDKGSDGWFYKTSAEWEQELTLSYYKVTKFTELLEKLGILQTKVQKRKGAPTVHYYVEVDALSAALEDFVQQQRAALNLPPLPAMPTRSAARASKRAEKAVMAEALLPTTDGGYYLFNSLADEYGALGRRAPVRFQSLTMKERFEQQETRLGANLEQAVSDALAKPILSLNGIIAYLGKWGQPNGKRFDNKVQAVQVAPGVYTDQLTVKQEAARARVKQAADKASPN